MTGMSILQQIDADTLANLPSSQPKFRAGDTLRVNVKVVEGTRSRIQAFEGVCIAKHENGLSSSFTVRKISFGEGVERVFPMFSPVIDSIEVVRRGTVRRAKLYYLRDRTGKSARIVERKANSEELARTAELNAIAAAAEAAEAAAKTAEAAAE